MKRHRALLGTVGLLVLALVMSGCLNLFGPKQGEVSGQVTWDGKGIIGAVVKAGGKTATTGIDGSYRLTGLEHGTYELTVTVDGEVASKQNISIGKDPATANVALDRTGPTELVVVRSAITEAATSMYPSYTNYMESLISFLSGDYTFMVLTDQDVIDGKLDGAKLVILNDQGIMTNAEVDAIRDYAQAGGKIFASYSTSIRNGDDEEYPNVGFQLADLYGVSWVQWTNTPRFTKIAIVNDHPIVEAFDNEIILDGTARHLIKIEDATPIGVLVDENGVQADIDDGTVLVVSDYGVYVSFVLLYDKFFGNEEGTKLIYSILDHYAPNARL